MFLFLFGAFLITPLSASAITSTGDPYLGSSWSGDFYEDGMGICSTFDKIEAFILSSDDVFEISDNLHGIRNFNPSTWTAKTLNPHYTVATGPALSLLHYTFTFEGNIQPITMDYLCYSNEILQFAQRITYNAGWSYPIIYDCGVPSNYPNFDNLIYDRSAVPLPGAVLLLGAGMARLVAYARRRQD
jgi:hypothetical protein